MSIKLKSRKLKTVSLIEIGFPLSLQLSRKRPRGESFGRIIDKLFWYSKEILPIGLQNTYTSIIRSLFPPESYLLNNLNMHYYIEELKTAPTRVLLEYLQKARGCGGSYSPNDQFYFSIEDLKAELKTREHIPNKKEAKIIRRDRAKVKR